MNPGTVLQLLGSALELGGLATVVIGISRTRANFTDRPSLGARAWVRIVRAVDQLRKRPKTVSVVTAGGVANAGALRVRVTVGSGAWEKEGLAERVENLKRIVDRHELELSALHERVDEEEKTRAQAVQELERRSQEIDRELRTLIREAAAGGLRLETLGALLFAAGLILGAVGNVID